MVLLTVGPRLVAHLPDAWGWICLFLPETSITCDERFCLLFAGIPLCPVGDALKVLVLLGG